MSTRSAHWSRSGSSAATRTSSVWSPRARRRTRSHDTLREGGIDEFGHNDLHGRRAAVGGQTENRATHRQGVRTTVLGHVQRGGTPHPVRPGAGGPVRLHATDAAHNGQFGQMWRCTARTSSVPLSEATKQLKTRCPSSATGGGRVLRVTMAHKLMAMTAAVSADLLDYDAVPREFEPVLGMEVHVELHTATKMFCPCPTTSVHEPNTQVCPVCLGMPGALPVVNQAAVESAIRIGLALNCSITPWGRFARKNYFYPDQPKNYQISQYDEPIATEGYLDVVLDDGSTWRVDIERAHMEEDTGKSLHVGGATGRIHGASHSLLDYNRAGVPLVEIVTKPITGAGERAPEVARATSPARATCSRPSTSPTSAWIRARCAATRTSRSCRSAPTCSAPARRPRTSQRSRASRRPFATRCAVRPPFSLGGEVIQETRHFQGATAPRPPVRRKETAEDYRYFPEPDLEPVAPTTPRGSRSCVARCPSCRGSAVPASRRSGASPTRRCATSSTPVPSTSSSRPPRPAHPRPRPAPGGWHTSRSRPTLAVSS